ncbi:cytochrome P450 [Sphaerisporangium siamense]|uniref:Pentalenolactone synthase n=1 Tax=Sphaerisporangium siamense TaxID=795645 RepID=A0A7W7GAB4_9ACTN|nr:cytochrome P450 [Sphaerisporangium siamense]MBB4699806.1 pentalenolactone synthase [Sphaerisporangium siamense]GII87986.1 cytochrome P450 [Sphaerisporangium siamense]
MSDLPQLPFPRRNRLEMSPKFRELRATAPIVRVRTGTGDEAWFAVRYDVVRTLLGDDRFGRTHPDPENAPRVSHAVIAGVPRGGFETEKADHARMRKLLTPAFSARRMKLLSGHVQDIVDELLDELAAKTPPADLHAHLSVPLPALVISELLGVPREDRERFRALADAMTDMSAPGTAHAALEELSGYIHELMVEKRRRPAEDVFSDMATMDADDQEVAELGAMLLFAGHETTVNRIDHGVAYLLTNPDQRDALAADPSLAPAAVEEILRMSAPSDLGVTRWARTDVEIGGVTIRRGDAVIVGTMAANRDEGVFQEPDRFDILRHGEEPHLAFAHGMHYCIGASLARVELRSVFGTLFRRFPALELAVPLERIPVRTDRVTGGFAEMPVVW